MLHDHLKLRGEQAALLLIACGLFGEKKFRSVRSRQDGGNLLRRQIAAGELQSLRFHFGKESSEIRNLCEKYYRDTKNTPFTEACFGGIIEVAQYYQLEGFRILMDDGFSSSDFFAEDRRDFHCQ